MSKGSVKTQNPFSSATQGKSGYKPLPQISVNDYKYGTISFLEPQQIPRGAAASSLNWRTQGSKIETRAGYTTIGSILDGSPTGVGEVQGCFTGHTWNGTEVLFQVSDGKLQYYNTATSAWVQIGSNLFGGAAINDKVFFAEYISTAGAQVWCSSPNSQALIKIMTANPGSYTNMYYAGQNFCGYIKIVQNAMWMWNYRGLNAQSTNAVLRSYIDAQTVGDSYTQVTAENRGSGDGTTKTFTGTLTEVTGTGTTAFGTNFYAPVAATANISAITQAFNGEITTSGAHGLTAGQYVIFEGISGMTQLNGVVCLVQSVIDSTHFTINVNTTSYTAYSSSGTVAEVEFFQDDYLGNLTSNLGGTGTINYTTGAYSLTFNTAPVSNSNNVQVNYYYENSFNQGLADFTPAYNMGARIAGSATSFLEGSGGPIMNLNTYNGVEYVIHEKGAWTITTQPGDDDATNPPTNLLYRNNVAMLSPRGSIETGKGIYFINTLDPTWPYLALISYNEIGTQVIPTDVSSEKLNMSNFIFDNAVLYEAAIADATYIVICCRTSNSTINNRMILYNENLEAFDVMDFYAACLTEYGGNLCGGDSITNNFYQFFTGYDDNDAIPYTYWIGNIDNYTIEQLKQVKQFWIEGEIDENQTAQVYVSLDRGNFVLVGTIYGNGSYVDQNSSIMIGSEPVGTTPVGGAYEGVTAHNHYEIQMRVALDKFQNIQIMYQTTGIGYFSVSQHVHFDIRPNESKLPSKYRVAPVSAGVTASTSNQNVSSYALTGLNGSATVFQIPANLGVLSITSSSTPFTFRQGIDFTVSGVTLTFSNTVTASLMLASGTTITVLYTPAPPSQTPPVATYDLSNYLNGVSASFTIPFNQGVFAIASSSAPFTFRAGIDYTVSGRTLTFLSTITPAVTLATGQTLIVYYYE